MARNLSFQILRGPVASLPILGDGEFYFATDTAQLYVGFGGGTLKVGNSMPVQIQDSVGNNLTSTAGALDTNLKTGAVSIGTSLGKTAILKTGQLTTTTTTANQVVLTYTVTAGKTLYLEYIDIQARPTVLTATAAILGPVIIQIGGITVYTASFVNPTTSDQGSQAVRLSFSEPIPLAAGITLAFLTTPASVTSMLWTANFGGYEK